MHWLCESSQTFLASDGMSILHAARLPHQTIFVYGTFLGGGMEGGEGVSFAIEGQGRQEYPQFWSWVVQGRGHGAASTRVKVRMGGCHMLNFSLAETLWLINTEHEQAILGQLGPWSEVW
ncbi:unnamed protein product [Discosporangium mesarthrocarpum]